MSDSKPAKPATPAKPDGSPDMGRALHGPRSEVNWEGGSGRQPYANRGSHETTESDNHEVEEGNRREQSGRNLDQLDKSRGTP